MTDIQNQDRAGGLDAVRAALAEDVPGAVSAALRGLDPPQLADLLESLAPEARERAWRLIEPAAKGDVLVEARGEVRRQLIDLSSPDELAAAVGRLDLDELSDIHDELPAAVVEAVLRAMDAQRRERFDLVRRYPEDSAGGLMDVDVVSVRQDATLGMVQAVLARYRSERGALPDHLDAVVVADQDGRYLGRLPLSDLVSLERELTVGATTDREAPAIPADTPAPQVARIFADRDLVSAAVVDAHGRVIGRITVDDVLDLVRESAEHAALANAGLDEDADTFAPAWKSARQRALWLGINLVSAFVAASVIRLFDDSIERFVALAVLMPVVASMGGVAGTQSLALVVRGLALEQIGRGNRWRLLWREVAVGALNGFAWALVVAVVASVWFGSAPLALVFGFALAINLLAGAALGTVIPLVLARLRIDPALAGGVVLIALTGALGFLAFLGIASAVLD